MSLLDSPTARVIPVTVTLEFPLTIGPGIMETVGITNYYDWELVVAYLQGMFYGRVEALMPKEMAYLSMDVHVNEEATEQAMLDWKVILDIDDGGE